MAIHLIIFDNYIKFIYEQDYVKYPTNISELHQKMYGNDVYIESLILSEYQTGKVHDETIRQVFNLHRSNVNFIECVNIDTYLDCLKKMLQNISTLHEYRKLCCYRCLSNESVIKPTGQEILSANTNGNEQYEKIYQPIPTHVVPNLQLRSIPLTKENEKPFDITDDFQYEDDKLVHPFYNENIQGGFAPLVPINNNLYDVYVSNLVMPETIYYLYFDKLNFQCRISSEISNHYFTKSPYFPEIEFIADIYDYNMTQENNTFVTFIRSRFIDKFFATTDDVKKLVEALLYTEQIRSNFYENEKKQVKNMSEFTPELFKNFINFNFELSQTDEHKIKSSHLMEMLKTYLDISKIKYENSKLSSMMPIVLQELGLKKKRYKDGNYWYGLQKRSVDNEFSERIKKQQEMNESIKHNSPEHYEPPTILENYNVIFLSQIK